MGHDSFKLLTRRINLQGRLGLRGGSLPVPKLEIGMALINQAPCIRHWIRCSRTNSYDSLYNLALKFLWLPVASYPKHPQNVTHRTGTFPKRSSSNSSSFIWRSRTSLYSLSANSVSTSCHGRVFSSRRACFTLHRQF